MKNLIYFSKIIYRVYFFNIPKIQFNSKILLKIIKVLCNLNKTLVY